MYLYLKAVIRDSGGYCSILDSDVRYEPGRVAVARCNYGTHEAPAADCECGIYSVPLSLRGLAKLSRYLPPELWVSLIAVQPIGRAYSDGVVVRSERVLTLGVLEDWRALVPRQLRGLSERELVWVLGLIDARPRLPWQLASLRHVLGRGCYPPERMRRIARLCGMKSGIELQGSCPVCYSCTSARRQGLQRGAGPAHQGREGTDAGGDPMERTPAASPEARGP